MYSWKFSQNYLKNMNLISSLTLMQSKHNYSWERYGSCDNISLRLIRLLCLIIVWCLRKITQVLSSAIFSKFRSSIHLSLITEQNIKYPWWPACTIRSLTIWDTSRIRFLIKKTLQKFSLLIFRFVCIENKIVLSFFYLFSLEVILNSLQSI